MKVLIIGGTGNISTPISRLLLDEGVDVTLFNRGQTKANIPDKFHLIKGDRYNYPAFEMQMKNAGIFDCVIDMIGYAPEDVNSLIRAFDGRTGQIIFCSTVDVYTKPAKAYPIVEGVERHPSTAFRYAYNKAICEKTLEKAAERGAFALTIIRPAHTYCDSRTPIPFIGSGVHLFKRIRQGKPIIVLGNGKSFWASAHRDDVAPTFVAAVGNKSVFGKSYHVAAEEWMTWEQHFTTVANVMNAESIKFVHIPTDILGEIAPKAAEWSVVNFSYNNIFDNSAAKRDLEYRYNIEWRQGVESMIAYHDAHNLINTCPDDDLYNHIVTVWLRLTQSAVEEMKPYNY